MHCDLAMQMSYQDCDLVMPEVQAANTCVCQGNEVPPQTNSSAPQTWTSPAVSQPRRTASCALRDLGNRETHEPDPLHLPSGISSRSCSICKDAPLCWSNNSQNNKKKCSTYLFVLSCRFSRKSLSAQLRPTPRMLPFNLDATFAAVLPTVCICTTFREGIVGRRWRRGGASCVIR